MSTSRTLEAEILRELTPTAAEEGALAAAAHDLEQAAQAALAEAGLAGRAAVQGSVAKGTWLRGGADIDLFLFLYPCVPLERLESAAVTVGAKVLHDARRKYAQHPYLSGAFQGHAVDLVPAYAVATAAAKMSAVDRTPFHTAWVRDRLDAAARGQVRLAKRWLKGVGCYGAQTALGGFSGYLVEVLVARHGSLDGLLAWLAAGAKPRRIVLGPDQVTDDVSPLVVVDPVDPARNCAAAVTPWYPWPNSTTESPTPTCKRSASPSAMSRPFDVSAKYLPCTIFLRNPDIACSDAGSIPVTLVMRVSSPCEMSATDSMRGLIVVMLASWASSADNESVGSKL